MSKAPSPERLEPPIFFTVLPSSKMFLQKTPFQAGYNPSPFIRTALLCMPSKVEFVILTFLALLLKVRPAYPAFTK